MAGGVRDGRLYAAVGSSRSGKTAWVMGQLAGRARQLIWDIEGQYRAQVRCRTVPDLARQVLAIKGGPGVIAYTGALADVEAFCRIAFEWAKAGRAACALSCVVLEETADFTSPGKAPPAFGVLIRRGLKYGCDIYAITQRPAESDKTTFGNAGFIHCCRLALPRDRVYMASFMATTPDRLAALKSDRDAGRWDYLQHDLENGSLAWGSMTIGAGGRPVFKANKREKPL